MFGDGAGSTYVGGGPVFRSAQRQINGAGNHAHNFNTNLQGKHGHTVAMNDAGNHSHTITLASVGDHAHTLDNKPAGAHTHTVTVTSLTLGGTRVPPGTYPPGTQFPVTGTISDPGCLLGSETFKGVWTVLSSTLSGQGTREVTWTVNNGELTGTATCKTAALVTLFTDQVDLKVGGPSEDVTDTVSFSDVSTNLHEFFLKN